VTDFLQNHPHGQIVTMDEMSLYLQATLTRVRSPRGQTPVPSITVTPDVTVAPNITIEARDESSDGSDYDDAMRSNSSLSGSEGMLGGNRS